LKGAWEVNAQARRRVEGAYKSLGQSAAELTGMRSPYR
jgi:hypothetical protein